MPIGAGLRASEVVSLKVADIDSSRRVIRIEQGKGRKDRYAMLTTLPSVSSLPALRTFAKRARASRPFLGIGNPKLRGKTGSGRGMKLASLFTPRGVADVRSVRRLPSLPESAGELKSLARSLGAGDDALTHALALHF